MPKTSKRKKYNARFPPARIKKIMQTDEEVGKVAAAVPVIISRALELFIESLITETSQTTLAKNAKTLSTTHIKQTIESKSQFDFLRDLVSTLPDHQTEESNGDNAHTNGDGAAKRGRGRPRKQKVPTNAQATKGESSKPSSDTSEDEEEDDEETETDEEEREDVPVSSTNSVSAPSISHIPSTRTVPAPFTSLVAPSTSTATVPTSLKEALSNPGQSTARPPEPVNLSQLAQENAGPSPSHQLYHPPAVPDSAHHPVPSHTASPTTAQSELQSFPSIPMLPASAFPPYTPHPAQGHPHPAHPYSCTVLPPQIPGPFPPMTMPGQMSVPLMPPQHPANPIQQPINLIQQPANSAQHPANPVDLIHQQNPQPVNSAVPLPPSMNLLCSPANAGLSQAPTNAAEDDDYDT